MVPEAVACCGFDAVGVGEAIPSHNMQADLFQALPSTGSPRSFRTESDSPS